MSRRVDFANSEVMDRVDLTRMGEFALEGQAQLAGGAIGYPSHWARFTVAVKSAQEVTVAPGEFYKLDEVYSHLEASDENLQPYIPLVAGTKRWVALLVGGSEHTLEENRAIQTEQVESDPPVYVTRQTPKVIHNKVQIAVLPSDVAGSKPGLDAGACCIAFVLLGTAGIEEIEPHTDHRVITLFEVEGRLKVLESRVDRLRQDTITLATDLGGLASYVDTFPNPLLFRQFSNDIARLNELARLEPDSRNYWFDWGIVPDDWDLDHPLSTVRIESGLRFQPAAIGEFQLRLDNPSSPDIMLHAGGTVMPAYDEVLRIENPVGAVKKRVANIVHTETITTWHTRTHSATTYSPAEMVCENTAGWSEAGLRDRAAGSLFSMNGQTYNFVGLSDIAWNNTATAQQGHLGFQVQQVHTTSWSETYATYHTETYGLNNAAFAQSMMTSQSFMMTGLGINLTLADPNHEATIAIGFLNDDGSPSADAMIGYGTLEGSELKLGWNKFPLEPILIEQKRFAATLPTPGNNEIALTEDNRLTGGSFFTITDGVYASGSTTQDMSLQVWGAKFRKSRTFIDFGTYDLPGGMTHVQMIHQQLLPKGTAIAWFVKLPGDTDWIPMDRRGVHPLTSLPSSIRLGAWLVGTEDVAPAIQLDQYSRVRLMRLRNDMVAVSKARTFGFATETVQIKVHVDAFDADLGDTVDIDLEVGGSIVNADSITPTVDPKKATRTLVKAVFDFTGAPITEARVIVRLNKTVTPRGPFAQDIQLDAF
jgi:hypothetical protein